MEAEKTFGKVRYFLILFIFAFPLACGKGKRLARFIENNLLVSVHFTAEVAAQPSSNVLYPSTTKIYMGTFRFQAFPDPITISRIRLTQYASASADAVSQIRLYLDDGDGVYNPELDQGLFGSSVASLDASKGADFFGSLLVPVGGYTYLHVVVNIQNFATGEIGFELSQSSDIGADIPVSSPFPVRLGKVLVQSTPSWQYSNPFPGDDLEGIWGVDLQNVYIVGEGGFVAKWDGSSWRRLEVPAEGADINEVWANGEDNVYCVGQFGTILYFNGQSWSKQNSNSTAFLNGIWGDSNTGELFAVGSSGTILYSPDGKQWQVQASGTTNTLYDVWGSSAKDVYAVGRSGTLLHYNGQVWSAISLSPSTTQDLNGVWGAGADSVFVVGDGGTIYHYNGQSWSQMASNTTVSLYKVSGTSGTSVVAVGGEFSGENGVSLYFDGNVWKVEQRSGETLKNVANIAGQIYAVGIRGKVLQRTSSEAQFISLGSSHDWESVFTFGEEIFVAGEQGSVAYYDGQSWRVFSTPAQGTLRALWGSAAADLFAVGDGGAIVHYDGQSWQAMVSSTTRHLRGIWGYDAGNIWAVGDGGTILYYDGANWSAQNSGTTANLYGIWGNYSKGTPAPKGYHIYVVGDNGTILRSTDKGATWQAMTSNTAQNLRAIHGLEVNEVYAVGENGTVQRYDGLSWSARNTGIGNNTHLYTVFLNRFYDIYTAGSGGEVYVFDLSAGRWNLLASMGVDFKSLWGDSWGDHSSNASNPFEGSYGNAIYLAGAQGAFFKGPRWQAAFRSFRITKHTAERSSDLGAPMYALPNSDVIFACTNEGNLLRFDGKRWHRYLAGPLRFRSIWAYSATAAYAVGDEGSIYHFDGKTFRPQNSTVSANLYSVWGTGDGAHIFVSGASGTILYSSDQGKTWVKQNSGVSNSLRVIRGFDASRVYACGSSGVILYTTDQGSTWTRSANNPADTANDTLHSLLVLSPTQAFAAGDDGSVLYTTDGGVNWVDSLTFSTKDFVHLWGDSFGNVYAVGDGGSIAHFNGMSWSAQTSPVSSNLRAILGFGQELHIVGAGGTVLYSDDGGKTWSQKNVGTDRSFYWIVGSSPTQVWASASSGVWMQYK